MKRILTTLPLACPLPALAIELIQPLDCSLGDTCYLQQFVDHDRTAAAQDFRCGAQTYDTHKGTDFALPSLRDQADGVTVVAAASGVVFAVRNDMIDALQGQIGSPDITGKECGNGVVIRHADGWETQYCHMARGSIGVSVGATVTAGEPLGSVGLSGATEFPHLHFSLRKDGQVVDPFAATGAECSADTDSLWIDAMPAPNGGLIAVGFAPNVPDYASVKAGTAAADRLMPDQNIVFWGFAHGGQVGDVMRITIIGPEGPFHTNDLMIEDAQAQFMRASGRRAPQDGWTSGAYTGRVTLLRDGQLIDTRTATITVP